MKSGKKVILTVIVLVGLVAVFFFASKIITNLTGHVIGEGNPDGFAKCLTEKEVKMYGALGCGHCQNQKALFGDSFQYISYIECTENPETCSQAGVQGYPTWEVNGQLYPGEKTLSKLAELSNCKLN